jgi:hypothetical protein
MVLAPKIDNSSMLNGGYGFTIPEFDISKPQMQKAAKKCWLVAVIWNSYCDERFKNLFEYPEKRLITFFPVYDTN